MSDWNDAVLSDTRYDPLLDALVLITRLYEKPYSRDALIAGLPVEEGKLDTQQFIVAAERAGLSARLLKRSLEKVSQLTLPALLLLKGRQTAILLKLDHEQRMATIMRPECGNAEETIAFDDLNEEFSGYLFLIKQKHNFEGRKEQPHAYLRYILTELPKLGRHAELEEIAQLLPWNCSEKIHYLQ